MNPMWKLCYASHCAHELTGLVPLLDHRKDNVLAEPWLLIAHNRVVCDAYIMPHGGHLD
jgi:hypothetical protein